MTRRSFMAVVAAALLIAALTACDGNDPSTAPSTVTSADPNKPRSVPDPIEPTAFIKEPCSSLTPEQQKKYHLDSGEPNSHGAEWCVYNYIRDDRLIRVGYDTSGDGLYGPGELKIPAGERWDTEVLDNYPAAVMYPVDRSTAPSNRLYCSYMVGLNKTRFFTVVAPDADGGCALAKEIARLVLSNIKKHR